MIDRYLCRFLVLIFDWLRLWIAPTICRFLFLRGLGTLKAVYSWHHIIYWNASMLDELFSDELWIPQTYWRTKITTILIFCYEKKKHSKDLKSRTIGSKESRKTPLCFTSYGNHLVFVLHCKYCDLFAYSSLTHQQQHFKPFFFFFLMWFNFLSSKIEIFNFVSKTETDSTENTYDITVRTMCVEQSRNVMYVPIFVGLMKRTINAYYVKRLSGKE